MSWRLWLVALAVMFAAKHSIAGNEKYQLTLLTAPTIEWVRFSQGASASALNEAWGSKLSYNFGFEYKRFFDPSLSFTTGLLYMNKGFRNVVLNDPTVNPTDGQSQVGVTLMSTHIAAVPLYINIHHRLRRKVEMIYTLGVAGGYVFSERIRNNYYSGEATPEQGFIDNAAGASPINLFVDYYAGLHAGAGISTYLKSRLVMIIQPMYKWQLHDARDYFGPYGGGGTFAMRLNSFGIDLKIGYYFTKQIRNRKKEF
jgi:hypothetical protein